MVAVFRASIGLIIYTFLGYPAIMALRAALHPQPSRPDPNFRPNVSLIIAAHNEGAVIAGKLANAAESDYPADRLEVIVVADGSDDDTVERARAVSGAKVLFEPDRRGKLAAVTRAAREATGEVVAFSDANNMYSRGTITALVAPLADPSVGVVTGRKQISRASDRSLDQAEGLYWRYESRLKEWESAVGSVTAVAGEVLAFRREALYPTSAGMLTEDFVQAMTAASKGWRVAYAPAAVSVEAGSATIDDEATRRARIVTGRWQAMTRLLPAIVARQPGLAWQILSHKGLRPLVPGALLALGASSASLARTRRSARLMALAQLGFYLTAALGRHDETQGTRRRWTYLPYYFCRMNGAAMSGLVNFLRRRRDAAWTRVARG